MMLPTMQMRTIVTLMVLTLVGVGGAGIFLNSQEARSHAQPEALASGSIAITTTTTVEQKLNNSVVIDARVVPVRSAELDFGIRGVPVTDILVEEGDVVAQGAPLARLDTRDLLLRVEQAQAALARVQADYDRLVEEANPAQVKQARAQIDRAQAELQQTQGRVAAEDIAAAEDRLEQARTRLAILEAGPNETERQVVRSVLDQARANLDQQRAALSATKEEARRAIEGRANAVREAQIAYSTAYWDLQNEAGDGQDPREMQSPANTETRDLVNALERAQLDLADAEADLEQARVNYDVAKQDEISGLNIAAAEVAAAQAELDDLLAGADPDELAAARADVTAAEAALAQLQGTARTGELEAASAQIADAQARLEGVTAGPTAAEIAQAAAAIQQAQVNLKQSELSLESATLTAPMAGVIAAINTRVGEIPTGSTPAIVLADVNTWQLETEDLTDLSVVQIREGAPVKITFYALPEVELTGTVTRVKPLGENDANETTYTVIITPGQWDDRLRWNMVGQVAIVLDE